MVRDITGRGEGKGPYMVIHNSFLGSYLHTFTLTFKTDRPWDQLSIHGLAICPVQTVSY